MSGKTVPPAPHVAAVDAAITGCRQEQILTPLFKVALPCIGGKADAAARVANPYGRNFLNTQDLETSRGSLPIVLWVIVFPLRD